MRKGQHQRPHKRRSSKGKNFYAGRSISSPIKHEKIPVEFVMLKRAEGPHGYEIGEWFRFSSIAGANSKLYQNSLTAPKGGAYDKHDFRVIWKDGQSYDGRYDLHNGEYGDIGGHMKGFLEYLASGKGYQDSPNQVKDAKEMLSKYSFK